MPNATPPSSLSWPTTAPKNRHSRANSPNRPATAGPQYAWKTCNAQPLLFTKTCRNLLDRSCQLTRASAHARNSLSRGCFWHLPDFWPVVVSYCPYCCNVNFHEIEKRGHLNYLFRGRRFRLAGENINSGNDIVRRMKHAFHQKRGLSGSL